MAVLTKKQTVILIVVAGALITAGTLWLKRMHPGSETGGGDKVGKTTQAVPKNTSKAALTVTPIKPQSLTWERTLEATGNIAAWQEAIVGSEIGGLRLVNIKVAIGNVVKRGQLLAELSNETVEADLAQMRANVSEAQAALAEAQANAERARQLQSSGALSKQQINQYTTAEQTAQARLQAAQARARVEEIRLKQTRIVAPDDGVISARTATVGAVVQAGQELFRLIRKQRLEWRAEVTASELSQIRTGMQANVLAADGTQLNGTVRMVGPVVDAQTRNAIVYVDIKNSDARAGMFARGTFEVGRTTALTLPQSAVQLRDGFTYVYRLNNATEALQKVTETKVRTGRREGDRIEILQGLEESTLVVGAGVGFLADGDTVHVISDAATRKAP